MNLVKATVECALCPRRFHQIDSTEERALSIARAAMDKHLSADHPAAAALTADSSEAPA
jgi:hypothetical protein